MYIYVESEPGYFEQIRLAKEFRKLNYEVYNSKEAEGYRWANIDPNWRNWTNTQYLEALQHFLVTIDYKHTQEAMLKADAFVLVNPGGPIAHLAAGWALGRGIPTALFIGKTFKVRSPMYRLFGDNIFTSDKKITQWLEKVDVDCGQITDPITEVVDKGSFPTGARTVTHSPQEFSISIRDLP